MYICMYTPYVLVYAMCVYNSNYIDMKSLEKSINSSLIEILTPFLLQL